MTEMALTVRGLCKAYPRFRLEDVSLNVPRGTVVGLIGENGAGKSTLISAALGLVKRDAGAVSVLGKETLDAETLGQVGVVFDGNNFPDVLSPAKLGRVLSRIYPSWDEPGYAALLERLGVPPDQKLSEMSKGTRTKLSIVTALSHGSRLLVLDEPTSGLDPVVRDDILDLLWDFVQDEQNAVLISSHILGELEKIATHYGIIRQGKMIMELSAKEMDSRAQVFVSLKTKDTKGAKELLARKFAEVREENGYIRVYDVDDTAAIVDTLMKNNHVVNEIKKNKIGLEEYYIDLMKEGK